MNILKFTISIFLTILLLSSLTLITQMTTKDTTEKQNKSNENAVKPTIAIHGGAGNLNPDRLSAEFREAYEDKLKEALSAGYDLLAQGADAMDAVEAAIKVLEDSPLFNAGKGAVFTHDEKNELDASLMDGKTLNAGAVANLTNVKNPIMAARKVLEESKHVFLIGEGAEIFARSQGLEMVKPEYFYTERRFKSLKKIQDSEEQQLEHSDDESYDVGSLGDEKYGTVGAVALDKNGNLAAGTSTGGLTNKKFGRIGDSPVIGAGTYADNQTCAVSCTGDGEFFIRKVAAYEVAALMKYQGLSVKAASEKVIASLKEMGADGGMITLDAAGNVSMPMNTSAMFRGVAKAGSKEVMIFE